MCGAESLPGKSYCKTHYEICYQKNKPSKRKDLAFAIPKILL